MSMFWLAMEARTEIPQSFKCRHILHSGSMQEAGLNVVILYFIKKGLRLNLYLASLTEKH